MNKTFFVTLSFRVLPKTYLFSLIIFLFIFSLKKNLCDDGLLSEVSIDHDCNSVELLSASGGDTSATIF